MAAPGHKVLVSPRCQISDGVGNHNGIARSYAHWPTFPSMPRCSKGRALPSSPESVRCMNVYLGKVSPSNLQKLNEWSCIGVTSMADEDVLSN